MGGRSIVLIGALDTKGHEYAFLRDLIRDTGHTPVLVDVGTKEEPSVVPDIPRSEVLAAIGAGDAALGDMDRGEAVALMSRAVAAFIPRLHAQGRLDGVLALGGTGGTAMATAAMRELPLGVPKVMVSTAAGGDVSGYVGVKDIVMIPSIVDVAGINRISRAVFAGAAGAICGMVETEIPAGEEKPLIAASMFGNTTPAVDQASAQLAEAGYEVLVFHCTGNGGRSLENLVREGHIVGVLDITTTELADDLAGGVFSAGPDRLTAAATTGVPWVVTPGCLDMVNFWAPETIPEKHAGRTFYRHNPNVTLMRTTPEENAQLGRSLAEKVNASTGPVTVLLPLKGVSMIDGPSGAFYDPAANEALFGAIRDTLRDDIALIEMDNFINDETFADRCASELIALMKETGND